jgi:hypothetical protein
MKELTPQDLGSSISILNYLKQYTLQNGFDDVKIKIDDLLNQYKNIMEEPDPSDKTLLPYNRRDAYSILEYLKVQAEQLSEGRWTDFSDADIGTVFLKLLAYLADMNNFQVDKVVSELYMSTCIERASALSLSSLIGYEPRHYLSSYCTIELETRPEKTIEDGAIIPEYSEFTNNSSAIKFCNLEEAYFYNNKAMFKVYQGNPIHLSYSIKDISTLGRIILPDYYIGINTMSLSINGQKYKRVDNVRFETGDLCFSVHISTEQYLYIQLPAYWTDLITQGSVIQVDYLISSGSQGRIGKNILTKIEQISTMDINMIQIKSNTTTEGGYDPETVDEMRISVPRQARTMNTIVTINDFEEVSLNVEGISDVSALDYNDPSSGLIQPDDYYKVHMYVLPKAEQYIPEDEQYNKYRNTIIKDRADWTIDDMSIVADDLDIISVLSITGSNLTLEGRANFYSTDDIVPSINRLNESYLIEKVDDVSSVTDRIVYSIKQSGNNYVLTFNSVWKQFVVDTDKINIYYKKEQVLTDKGQALREYVDERRLTSLNVTYHELDVVQPTIIIDVFMDKYDTRFETTASQVKDFIINRYSRDNLKIGEPLFASVIGSDILQKFDYIRYCEVRDPEELIEVNPRGFIDVVPYIIQNGQSIDKIIVNVNDYQNRII